jgi:hypothetical protein
VLAVDRFRSTTADDDNRLPVQSFNHTTVSTLSLSRSRFVVGPYLDLAVFLTGVAAFTATNRSKRTFLSSSCASCIRATTRFTSCCPERPESRFGLTAHSMSHVSLQHIQARQVHLVQTPPRPLCSALRVWLPSRRFSPCQAAPALFHADSALGIQPFEAFPSRRMATAFPLVAAPTYCLSRVFSTCDKHKPAGHTGRSFWVPVRRESLAPPPVLGVSSTGCSLGLFCLPGLTGRTALAEISLSLPSRAFQKTVKPFTAAPQGLNRRSPGLTVNRASSNATNRQTTL